MRTCLVFRFYCRGGLIADKCGWQMTMTNDAVLGMEICQSGVELANLCDSACLSSSCLPLTRMSGCLAKCAGLELEFVGVSVREGDNNNNQARYSSNNYTLTRTPPPRAKACSLELRKCDREAIEAVKNLIIILILFSSRYCDVISASLLCTPCACRALGSGVTKSQLPYLLRGTFTALQV
jgi:hypothetical protein